MTSYDIVIIGSGKGFSLFGAKPLPEALLIYPIRNKPHSMQASKW